MCQKWHTYSSTGIRKRIYYKKIDILDKYIDKIKEINIRAKRNKHGILGIFKDDTKYLNELINYKDNIWKDLNRLKACRECKCLECYLVCEFNACMKCDPNIKVSACDKEKV